MEICSFVVPTGKNMLSIFEEWGSDLDNFWIFIHHNMVENLKNGVYGTFFLVENNDHHTFELTNYCSDTFVQLSLYPTRCWNQLLTIQGNYFYQIPDDPKKILFLQ